MSATLLGTSVAANGSAGSSTITATHTLSAGSNRRVVVIATLENSTRTIDSATYGGVAMTSIAHETAPDSESETRVFEVLEASLPADGSNDAVVTCSADDIAFSRIRVFCVQDADQDAVAAAQIAAASNSVGVSTSVNDSLTSITDGLILAGGIATDTDATDISYSGGTLGTETEHEGANGVSVASGCQVDMSSIPVTTGGTTTVTFENTVGGNNGHAFVAVCYSPVSGGGGGTTHGPLAGEGGLAGSGGLAGTTGILVS